jgi:RNase P subunit RPR2
MGSQSKKQSADGMHCCPNCDSTLVQPVNEHWRGDGHWNVELHCPECEWWAQGSYSQDEIDRYALELDRGDQELIRDLRALIRASMREEADRFAAALATDSILPEDFNNAGRGLA